MMSVAVAWPHDGLTHGIEDLEPAELTRQPVKMSNDHAEAVAKVALQHGIRLAVTPLDEE